jgi:hypothetical protein
MLKEQLVFQSGPVIRDACLLVAGLHSYKFNAFCLCIGVRVVISVSIEAGNVS